MANIWRNFVPVLEHVDSTRPLFRSSAPNYGGDDTSQNLTQEAVDFLVKNKIDRIVSFNHVHYTEGEMNLLRQAGIDYTHLPVEDFTAATLEQLKAANDVYNRPGDTKGTLVHCGFGHGRTGTGVTAIQLFHTKGAQPPHSDWEEINHVETEKQLAILDELKEQLQSQP